MRMELVKEQDVVVFEVSIGNLCPLQEIGVSETEQMEQIRARN